MQALLSIWVSFVMLFVSFVPGFVLPEKKSENEKQYPYVLVHGFLGWVKMKVLTRILLTGVQMHVILLKRLKQPVTSVILHLWVRFQATGTELVSFMHS